MNMAGNNIIAQFGAKLDAVQAQIATLSESNQAQLDAIGKIMQAQSESNQVQSESNQAQLAALGKLLDSRYQLLIWLIAGVGGVLTFILAYGTFVAAG